jgi:hypothetical protein
MKDIFYYQLKKKDKKKRLNIMFYMFHVIIKKHVFNQIIDFEGGQYLDKPLTLEQPVSFEHENEPSSNPTSKDNNDNKQLGKNEKSRQNTHTSREDVIKKCKYLYLITEKDEQLEIQMRYERERQKMMGQIYKVKTKDINVDVLLYKDPKSVVNVTRLQY